MEPLNNDARLPIILGVTGHRKLDQQDERLIQCIRAELLKLRDTFPHSPFVLLTGLADGADRIVARLAADCVGARLIAVLPFTEDEFRKDFTTEQQRQDYEALRTRCQASIIVPQRETVSGALSGEARNRQYARVGGYLVEHSQILIAVWNGQPARGTGGTGDVATWRLAGEVPAEFSPFDATTNVLRSEKPRPMIHINPATHTVRHVTGKLDTSKPDAALQALNRFNKETADCAGTDITRASEELLPRQNVPTAWCKDAGAARLATSFAMADVLAGHYQKQDSFLIAAMVSTFFLAMAFANQTTFEMATVFFLLFMGLIFVIDRWATRKKIEDKYFDYRALAEGLRVAFFWRVCGVNQPVWLNYLAEHTGVLAWVREALHSAEINALPATERTLDRQDIDAVQRLWLRNQSDYFSGKIKHIAAQTAWWKRVAIATLVVSWAAAATKLIVRLAHWHGGGRAVDLFTIVGGVMLGAGIAAEFYARKKGFEVLGKRYSLSEELSSRASRRLNNPHYPPQELVLRIGHEALNENASWLWLQRQTPARPRK